MLIVPVVSLPNQTFQVQLAGQGCQINIYQTLYGLFMDLYTAGNLIVGGVLAKNGTLIVRNAYFGFIGDFCFLDMQGTSDPNYTGLGGRFILIYFAPSDLPAGKA